MHKNEGAFVALFTLTLTVVTGFLVRRTRQLWEATNGLLEFAGEQAQDMKASIAVAKKSAEIANQSLTALQRAFVVQKKILTEQGTNSAGVPVLWIQIELENSGATPTRHLIHQGNFGALRGPLPEAFDFPDVEGDEPTRFVIGPKGSGFSSRMEIPISVVGQARDRQVHIYIWGWAEYDDIFPDSKRHRTEYCSRLTPIVDTQQQLRMEWKNYKYHNGMDGDCPPERWRTRKECEWIEPRRPRIPQRVLPSPPPAQPTS